MRDAPLLRLALRRLRSHPVEPLLLCAAVLGGCALVSAVSLIGAVGREQATHATLSALPDARRDVRAQVRYEPAISSDAGGEAVAAAAIDRLGELVQRPARVRVWGPLAPEDELGTRLVSLTGARAPLLAGRAPAGCARRRCEVLSLSPRPAPGQSFKVGATKLQVVGRTRLPEGVRPSATVLHGRAVLVSDGPAVARMVSQSRRFSVFTAPLRPGRVEGAQLGAIADRLERHLRRLHQEDLTSIVSGPVAELRQIDRRTSIAQRRLLVIGIEGAALLIAFVAFLATTRRGEVALGNAQLAYLGASAPQRLRLRVLETALPTGLAVAVALAGAVVLAEAVRTAEGFGASFVASALPLSTIAVLCGLALAGTFVAVGWGRAPRAARGRVGPLEAGALVALAVILWQASTTGGLDPAVLARRDAGVPVVLFVPVLAVVAGGVLLLRLLPLGFRALERLARHGPLSFRLALLGVVRRPALAAGATTFLAVALGSALFSLNYRTTLVDQGQAEAAFRAGAAWRTSERAGSATSVAPLTRYRSLTREPPTPVIRTAAKMDVVDDPIDADVEVLGIPHDRIGALSGWRPSFSRTTPARIGRALAKPRARFRGPRLAAGATAIRMWARAPFQSAVTVRLLTDGQQFGALPAGGIGPAWRHLQVAIPRGLRDATLASIVVGGSSTSSAATGADFGSVQQRLAGGRWVTVSDLGDWEAPDPWGESVLVPAGFRHGPVARGIRVTFVPIGVSLIRPSFDLPRALPALGGPDIPRGRVDVKIAGVEVALDVVARSRLLPTVTEQPRRFVLVDYDTLFAYLNGTQPGLIEPSEAWFSSRPPPGLGARLRRAPFRSAAVVRQDEVERTARNDRLALDAQALLLALAVVAALLGVGGLLIAAGAMVRDEAQEQAEYEAMGVDRNAVVLALRLRLAIMAALGVAGAVAGGVAGAAMTASLVAVSGAARVPLPPIEARVTLWSCALLLAAVAGAVALATARAARGPRPSIATRLRGT
ncbi:MAG: hypothetical protein ABI611_15890 [Solirubrobacteraceae bacterium]